MKRLTDIILTFDDGSTECLMNNGQQTVTIRAKQTLQRYIDKDGGFHDSECVVVSLSDSFAFVLPAIEPAEGVHVIEDVPDNALVVN